ncbi:MAG: uracil phosphoribosyltransferase [Alphaproteobacteria bacterium]|nr:uracil phosphoribosyltransferase [Alphaproteobacteria bacterium SS10]
MSEFRTLTIVNHPLIQHKLTRMRETSCQTGEFRRLLTEISLLMGYEVTRDLPLTSREVTTPLTSFEAPTLAERTLAIVPVLRAGLGMVDGLVDLMPDAVIAHIGLARDEETKKPIEYLIKLPPADIKRCIVVDPMLATGNSAAHAITVLKEQGGFAGDRLCLMTLVAAPEGVEQFSSIHPDVAVFTAGLDDHLNKDAYIVPGLGDAGDRLFGTL